MHKPMSDAPFDNKRIPDDERAHSDGKLFEEKTSSKAGTTNKRIPCIRCLLRESGDAERLQAVADYIRSIPKEKAVSKEVYEKRLSICKDCKWLSYGTCQKCGAYVEARAYQKENQCPMGEKMWQR